MTVAAVTSTAGISAAQAEARQANPCNFRVDRDSAYPYFMFAHWNNCTDHRQLVHVDLAFWPDEERCLPPGDTFLGAADPRLLPISFVRNAWLVRDC
ncbi:DUF6355 family natural product biosynthesis protein [Streptomyces humidus]|nr:DUF6355 family natural product biosynthesis protein [Streptomyces humidus]